MTNRSKRQRTNGKPSLWRGLYRGDNGGGCWLWTGKAAVASASAAQRYGKATVGGQTVRVHRAVFAAIYGYEPLVVMHRCDNGLCFRPDHLYPGTQSENIAESVERKRHHNARKTRCPQGHEYDETNTLIVKSTGHRQCRACASMRKVAA